MVLIVTYALNNKAWDYTALFTAIKNNGGRWWHFMESTWIVDTHYTADQFAKLLYPHIFTTDSLLVARLNGEHYGWLPKDAWDWLNSKQY
jgi:hypothetical protein